MIAVILAAGTGTRIASQIGNIPKSMIQIGGKTLLEWSLDALSSHNISETLIVTGFESDTIKKKIGNSWNGMKINFVYNDEYATKGNMFSLSKVKNLVKEEIIVLESDLLYDSQAISMIQNAKEKNGFLVTHASGSGDEVFVSVNKKNQIIFLNKKIPYDKKDEIIGEIVGISKYSEEMLPILFQTAEEQYNKGLINEYYEEHACSLIDKGYPMYAIQCNFPWIEIDNEEMLQKAKQEVYPLICQK